MYSFQRKPMNIWVEFSRSVGSDSENPWTATLQAYLSITKSQSLPKLTSFESGMPSNHLILWLPLLLLLSIFPSIRVFSKSILHIWWPKYWSFSFSISPSNEHQDWSPLGCNGWISLQSKGLSRVFSNTTVQKHQFFYTKSSIWLMCWVLNHSVVSNSLQLREL